MKNYYYKASPRSIRRIHFIGIAGVGMSGIAEVLHNLGYVVSGSDLQNNSIAKRLAQLGIKIFVGHNPENVKDAEIVVYSAAVAPSNVELTEARKLNIATISRALMLAELMRFKQGIAIAGTHGKTTTTSLVATIFAEAMLDPTFVIGGKLNSYGVNARLGKGEYFIAEADESDASFLHLSPYMSVITNIDDDHLEAYENSSSNLNNSFIEFANRVPFYGRIVLCVDCPRVQAILPKLERPYLTYGFNSEADIKITSWLPDGVRSHFFLEFPNGEQKQFVIKLAGAHNVQNATAAIILSQAAGIPIETIQTALQHFNGVGRRMTSLGFHNIGGSQVEFIDDYGHHPTEINAVIKASQQAWPKRRIVMVFQPHRYSRTKLLFQEFVAALSQVDALILLDVYPAGEEPILGYDSKSLYTAIKTQSPNVQVHLTEKNYLKNILSKVAHDNDLVFMQGAGDISKIAANLVASLKDRVGLGIV